MSMLSMQYAGTLLGRDAVIEFPDSKAEVRYTANGQMRWRVVDSQGHVSEGCEKLGYLQLSDHAFFELDRKTGFTSPVSIRQRHVAGVCHMRMTSAITPSLLDVVEGAFNCAEWSRCEDCVSSLRIPRVQAFLSVKHQ